MERIDIPEQTGVFAQPWSVRKFIGLLGVFGPAAIVASLSIGAGETIVVVRAGAWAGYDLLWLVLISCIVKGIFVTYLFGRYTAISGEYIGHRLVKLPGPRGWLLLLIVGAEMIGAPLGWVPIAKPCGDLFHFLLQNILPTSISEPVWENIITSLFVAAAILMSVRLSFERLEKQQIAICCILVVGTLMGTLLVQPDFLRTVTGTLAVGNLPSYPDWAPPDAVRHPYLTMSTTFGYVGGSVMSYLVYANWVGIHRWGLAGHEKIAEIRNRAFASATIDYLPEDPAEANRLKALATPLRWDVGLGALVLFFVTAAFMVSGAAVLYPLEAQFEGWGLLTNQAHVWSNIHPSLVWVYYVCILAALWGTLQALPEVYARVIQEFFEAIWPDRVWDYDRIKTRVCTYIFCATMIIVWADIPFDILTQIAGFILANFTIALAIIAAIYLNFVLPRPYRVNLPFLIGSVVSAAVLAAFAGINGWGLYQKLFGM